MVYQISKVCIALMYMQHKHMLYGKLHIHHYLVLDRSKNENVYSTPLRNEVWNVDYKMEMTGIDLCYKNDYILVCYISIILNMILSVCTFSFHESFIVFILIKHTIFAVLFCQMVLKLIN